MAARRAHNPEVGGSSPPPAKKDHIALAVWSFFMPGDGEDVQKA